METAHLIADIIVALIAFAALFRPQPALHKQFADKKDTDHKLEEISRDIKELTGEVQKSFEKQSGLRRPMYKTLTAHGNALYFLAGRMSAKGDGDGEHVKRILERAEHDGEGI